VKVKQPPYLFIEADDTNIALQREKAKRAEVKAGVAYEGWEKELYQTLDKELATEVYRACIRGEVDKVDRLLIQGQQKAFGDEVKEISRLGAILWKMPLV